MFTISKTESTLGQPATAKHQKQEIHSFTFDNVLREVASNDYAHVASVEERLQQRGYVLLPGGNDVLETFEAGPDTGGARFIIVMRLAHQTFVIELPSIGHCRTFMKEWGCAPSVFPYIALPEQKPAPNNIQSINLRRGY